MQEKCVLICDREDEICRVCKLILDREYRVETCSDCQNILEWVKKAQPDLIVIDHWMPGIAGEKAVKTLVENESTKDIPIILFSTLNDIENRCRRINATDFIKKPFDIVTLRETIRKHLN